MFRGSLPLPVYFKQDGIARGVNYERGNFRINSDHVISKVFTFGREPVHLLFKTTV